ncbi:HEAT repeat domain-containing protein [uncultured Microscilla sp.]|uniref:HEAT repeat domain-containing protein n=1 Tax=uncultured Microscilla sp. TaxID=432653 RepID=UPI0026268C90|nr:HEAT repeat domain-containing protein [uncultured Microscilla sp.]
MTIYTVENIRVDWEDLLERLKHHPSTQDFEHFKQVVSAYWDDKNKGEVLKASFVQTYEQITSYCEATQEFLLSIMFDFTITNLIVDILPQVFDQLLAQECSMEHEFLIVRYFIAYRCEGISKRLSVEGFRELMERYPSEQMQAHILTHVGDLYGYNIYVTPENRQAAIDLCYEYVQHPNKRLAYIASIELMRSLNFETADDIICKVVNAFVEPSPYMNFYRDTYLVYRRVRKEFLFSDITERGSTRSEKHATPADILFLTNHVSLFRQTGKKQFTLVVPLLLSHLQPQNHNSFIIQAIMLMVFGDNTIQNYRSFNKVQQQVLETLVEKQWLREDKITGELLEAHAIPQNFIDLQVLLNRQSDRKALPDFDKLYEVDWKNTTHAYGEATDVPLQIMKLCSEDNETREEAWWQLWGNLFHQGSRYPASVLAVPYFIDLLKYEQVADKEKIMQYLLGLTLGYPEYYIHTSLNYERDILNFENEDEAVMAELYHGVAEGIPVYLGFLEGGTMEEKQAAIFLLAWFYPFQKKIVPALKYFIEEEENEMVQANILLALSYLTSPTPANNHADFFRQWYQQAQNQWTKLAATIALYRLDEPKYRQEVLNELLQQLGRSVAEEQQQAEETIVQTNLPWVDEFGNMESFISGFFDELNEQQTSHVNQVLLEKIRTVSMFESLALNNILFRLNFEYVGKRPVAFDQLTKKQVGILQELLSIEQIWKVGNFMSLLSDYGLPQGRKEMGTFLKVGGLWS